MKSGRVARQMVHTTGRQQGTKRKLGTGMLTGSDHSPGGLAYNGKFSGSRLSLYHPLFCLTV